MTDAREPTTDERQVHEIVLAEWRRVLALDALDAQRGFLSHGGSSLGTLQVAAAIGKALALSDASLDLVLMALIADSPPQEVARVALDAARRPT